MSTQLILLTTGGTVKLEGQTIGGWIDFDQMSDKKLKLELVGDAGCELHRRIAVPAGKNPVKGDKNSLCMRLHAKNGAFDVLRVRTRPKLRKKGSETDSSMHKCKRELKVNKQLTQVTYTIKKKGFLFPTKKLQLTIQAIK
jgi:hypothetical protein